jgi:hypothetical protein
LAAPFAHERFTTFPLAGAHRTAACESCHARSSEPDAQGRRFGRVQELFGPVAAGGKGCITCHQDPHRQHFDQPHQPVQVADRTGCARCHDTASFRTLPHGFDHGSWTGFPLHGAHAKAACSACHAPQAADAQGRTWSAARGTQCGDCHQDPHGGQFTNTTTGRNDCARCHAGPAGWNSLVFKHDLHSRFKLGTAHQGLACGACHHSTKQGATEIIRYKPMGSDCVDCHGKQNDPLRRERPRKR